MYLDHGYPPLIHSNFFQEPHHIFFSTLCPPFIYFKIISFVVRDYNYIMSPLSFLSQTLPYTPSCSLKFLASFFINCHYIHNYMCTDMLIFRYINVPCSVCIMLLPT